MSEETNVNNNVALDKPVEEVRKDVVAESKEEIINALKKKYATSIRKVYINSLKTEVGFREITVNEQSTLSKMLLTNENRRDVSYEAQCSIIKRACLNNGFDIYSLSEFDKIKLQIAMYQSNVAKNTINFKCEKCGMDNSYKLDFDSVLKKMDDMDLSPITFNYKNSTGEFNFTIKYPSVRRVFDFYKEELKRHPITKANQEEANQQINFEYLELFIENFSYKFEGDEDFTTVNAWCQKKVTDIVDILGVLSQDVVYGDDGVITFIAENTINKINNLFEKHECLSCGHIQDSANIDGVQGFFS